MKKIRVDMCRIDQCDKHRAEAEALCANIDWTLPELDAADARLLPVVTLGGDDLPSTSQQRKPRLVPSERPSNPTNLNNLPVQGEGVIVLDD